MSLALGRGAIDLLAVLAIVIPGSLEDGKVQLGHGIWPHIGMPFGQVIDQHASSFEPQQARVALVDEPLVVCRRYLQVQKNME